MEGRIIVRIDLRRKAVYEEAAAREKLSLSKWLRSVADKASAFVASDVEGAVNTPAAVGEKLKRLARKSKAPVKVVGVGMAGVTVGVDLAKPGSDMTVEVGVGMGGVRGEKRYTGVSQFKFGRLMYEIEAGGKSSWTPKAPGGGK